MSGRDSSRCRSISRTMRPRSGITRLILALAEHGDLTPAEVDVADAEACELGAPGAEVEAALLDSRTAALPASSDATPYRTCSACQPLRGRPAALTGLCPCGEGVHGRHHRNGPHSRTCQIVEAHHGVSPAPQTHDQSTRPQGDLAAARARVRPVWGGSSRPSRASARMQHMRQPLLAPTRPSASRCVTVAGMPRTPPVAPATG
jgi:hypothetical protein